MTTRFEVYRQRHKKAAERRNAEVVNNDVFYRSKAEFYGAINDALTADRYSLDSCSELGIHPPGPCDGIHITIWDEEWQYINHAGYGEGELIPALPDGAGYAEIAQKVHSKLKPILASLLVERSTICEAAVPPKDRCGKPATRWVADHEGRCDLHYEEYRKEMDAYHEEHKAKIKAEQRAALETGTGYVGRLFCRDGCPVKCEMEACAEQASCKYMHLPLCLEHFHSGSPKTREAIKAEVARRNAVKESV